MDAMFDAEPLKTSPLFWFGIAVLAGSLSGTVMGLWLPRAIPLVIGGM